MDMNPLCRTCAYFLYLKFNAEKWRNEAACEKGVAEFPKAKVCRFWMREVGADDE
jgi:hypothetical protein